MFLLQVHRKERIESAHKSQFRQLLEDYQSEGQCVDDKRVKEAEMVGVFKMIEVLESVSSDAVQKFLVLTP